MTPFVNYEIQIYRRGGWKIESICDDRAIAIFEAKRIHRSGTYLGVRVVEERRRAGNGDAEVRIVYRSTKGEESGVQPAAQSRVAHHAQQAAIRKVADYDDDLEPYPVGGGTAGDSCAGAVILVLTLGAVLLGGIFAIIAVQNYFGIL